MPLLSTNTDLQTLTDTQLRGLVHAAADILCDEGDSQDDPSIRTLGNRAAAREVATTLGQADSQVVEALQTAFDATDTSRQISIKVLEELRHLPELARLIDARYESGHNRMSPEALLLTGALVVLAIRVRSIDL